MKQFTRRMKPASQTESKRNNLTQLSTNSITFNDVLSPQNSALKSTIESKTNSPNKLNDLLTR